jgi:Cu-Zn family superoxide dismutase
MLRTFVFTAFAAATLALASCATHDGREHGGHPPIDGTGMCGNGGMCGSGGMGGGGMMRGRVALATLTPTQGNDVRGLVVFHEVDGHLMVHARISGLKPNGLHGFHVHETGNCASADGTSAGGHFNPGGQPHGPQNAAHHAGDLPALQADANGVVDQKFELAGPTVAAGPASLVGRSVIVHAQADDYATQPTGNSGARIGCGVIAAH